MAEVFKAKSYGVEGFEKIIAIKRILPTMGEDRDFIKMFIDEAKIAGQLAHANICQIFELGRIDGSHFIAMEYIWGKDLLQIANRLRKVKQPMPISMASFVIAKVLEGLDYAHRKRDPLGRPLEIVHRDCSPQNVLVSYEGEVKVIDFGIAKATSRNSRTMAGVLKGKFGYMSPEQVRGLPLDRRSDIFAIGTMLYECLTSERLFQGETDFSTLEKVRNVDIAAPRAVNPAIPEAIEKIILKALAKDVDDRYQWCSEMLADLQAYLMSQDVVFTAKSLSSWLKDVFAQDIERERQMLEHYKRVGRDGLIAGVPSAQAKLDVNENLGEAGAPEGDATVLGGPNFEDVEKDTGAAPDIHQIPAAGGPRGVAHKKSAQSGRYDYEDGEGDFGEEAPTEIFGDNDATMHPPPPSQAQPAIGRAASVRDVQPPLGKSPPRPPPGARSTTIPPPVSLTAAATAQMRSSATHGHDGLAAAGVGQKGGTYPPPIGTGSPQLLPSAGSPIGNGGSGGAEQQSELEVAGPVSTVLGVQAPVGIGSYGGGYRQSAQMQAQQAPAMQTPPQHNSPYPTYAQSQGYSGYAQPSYQGYGGYPSGAGQGPIGAPLDPLAPISEGKRSTLVRDIGIGVGIAALVLVGFLLVKIVVLDNNSKSGTKGGTTSKLATVKLAMPAGIAAEMFVDGERAATVRSDSPGIPISAGVKHIKLVGTNGLTCDDSEVKLEAGKITTLECNFGLSGAGATGSAAGSSSGSSASQGATGAGDNASGSTTDTNGAKASDGKASDSKKVGDAKTGDPKAVDSKSSDSKKPAESRKGWSGTTEDPRKDSSSGDGKASDSAKSSDSKATETKGTPTSGAADPNKGYLQVFSKPPARILIDGGETNLSTPISGQALALSPGSHKITFIVGEVRFTYRVVIKAGFTETISKDLQ